jgi:iron complex transport system substrate-binding protein
MMIKRIYSVIILSLLVSIIIFFISACNRKSSEALPDIYKPSASSSCRIVQQVMGICIPTNPQRLVTLSLVTSAIALDLRVKPIGTTNFYQTKPVYLNNKLEGIKLLGRSQPNLEKLLLIKPDLILGWENAGRQIYPLLSKIAPTVLLNYQGAPSWREHFNSVAEVLGKKDVAQRAWNRYYQRVEKLKIALGDSYKHKTISFIYLGNRGIESDVKNSFAGSILNDIGLRRPSTQNVNAPYGIISISKEELNKADGDILFVTTWSDKDKQVLKKLQQKPLWKKLRAVQQNHVYFVDFATWTGSNLLAADAVIDDLFKYLINNNTTSHLNNSDV